MPVVWLLHKRFIFYTDDKTKILGTEPAVHCCSVGMEQFRRRWFDCILLQQCRSPCCQSIELKVKHFFPHLSTSLCVRRWIDGAGGACFGITPIHHYRRVVAVQLNPPSRNSWQIFTKGKIHHPKISLHLMKPWDVLGTIDICVYRARKNKIDTLIKNIL